MLELTGREESISIPAHLKCDRNIVESLQNIITLLEEHLKPLAKSEESILVDVFFKPELLFHNNSTIRKEFENGQFIKKLIEHCEKLLEENEEKLCVKVLSTLKEMMSNSNCLNVGDKGLKLQKNLLHKYFGKLSENFKIDSEFKKHIGPANQFLIRAGTTLHNVQAHLDQQGVSDLVINLMILSKNYSNIFNESIALGIALLEGGNPTVQKTIFKKLTNDSDFSQSFSKVFFDKLNQSQQEIKLSINVNSSDLCSKNLNDNQDNNPKNPIIF